MKKIFTLFILLAVLLAGCAPAPEGGVVDCVVVSSYVGYGGFVRQRMVVDTSEGRKTVYSANEGPSEDVLRSFKAGERVTITYSEMNSQRIVLTSIQPNTKMGGVIF